MERGEGGHVEGALAEAGHATDIPEAPPAAISTSEEMGSQEPQVAASLGAESALATSDSRGQAVPGGARGREGRRRSRGPGGRRRARGSAVRGRARGIEIPGAVGGPEVPGTARGPVAPKRARRPRGSRRGRGLAAPGGAQGPAVPGSPPGPAVPGSPPGPAVPGSPPGPAVPGSPPGPAVPGSPPGPAIPGPALSGSPPGPAVPGSPLGLVVPVTPPGPAVPGPALSGSPPGPAVPGSPLGLVVPVTPPGPAVPGSPLGLVVPVTPPGPAVLGSPLGLVVPVTPPGPAVLGSPLGLVVPVTPPGPAVLGSPLGLVVPVTPPGPEVPGPAVPGPAVPGSPPGPAVPVGPPGPAVPVSPRSAAVSEGPAGPEVSEGPPGPEVPGPSWARSLGSHRKPTGGKSIEKSMQAMSLKHEKSKELEEQFILRLPPEQAYAVRNIIHARSSAMKNKLKIDFSSDGHNAVVKVEDVSLSAKLVNLPCVIGSLKTIDRKTFYKTADISQMLVCRADSEPHHFPEEPVASTDPHVTASGDRTQKKKYNWKHGITPPLKNVRKKRFRKTTKELPDSKQMEEISFSEYIQSPSVEKEVKRLLCSDAEAVNIRWEVIADDDTKEVESQGCISGISEIPEMSGPSSSEYDILREMFGDSGSNSNDVEDKADTIEVQDDDDEDDSDDDDEDEEAEEDEEEKEIDNCEADLERELQDMFIQPSFTERDKDYDYSSIIVGIQKLIYYKEKKLEQIYKKAQRQKDLLRNVENLTLKRHFQHVLGQLNILEKQKCEEIYHLREQMKCFLRE